jgi:nucleoside-diphosphate-sugar epimerase
MIPRLIDSVREGKPISLNVDGRPRMNPVYVTDVVRVIEAALESEGDQLVNVAGDDAATIRELGELVGRAVRRDPAFEEGETRVAGDIVCENRLMRTVFGVTELTRLEEGLTRTVA